MSTPQTPAVEPNSLSETLLEIAAKHGNDASVDIVASYAAALSDSGRDALMQAIEECYPSNRAAFGVWQPIETAPTNQAVLVFIPNAEHYGLGVYRAMLVDMGTGRRWMTTALHCGSDCRHGQNPTHWMPLPPPPQD